MLCDACLSVFNAPYSTDKGVHHDNIESFRAAVSLKCGVCLVVQENIVKAGLESSILQDQHPFSYSYFLPGPPVQKLRIDLSIPARERNESSASYVQFNLVRLDDGDLKTMAITMRALRMAEDDFRAHIPQHTGDVDLCQGLIREWLDKCLKTHRICDRHRQAGWYPPRLIDLRNEQPRLILREEYPQGPYATLSHCWGPNPTFTTLATTNLEAMRRTILLADLPKNFQDSITDWQWQAHAIMMRKIYTNGVLNVSAARSVNAHGGLFAQREPHVIQPCVLRWDSVTNSRLPLYVIVDEHLWNSGVYTPLAQRAWVLQEKLLAPRAVHFSEKQVFWECAELPNACEMFPEGLPLQIYSTLEPAPFDIAEDGASQYYDHCWTRILTAYTNCALTKPDKDKFLALEGIVQRMETYFRGSDYVSGFFRHELPLALLWWLPDGGGIDKRPSRVYRAPSWSWASIDGSVEFPSPEVEVLSSLEDVHIKTMTERNTSTEPEYTEIVLQGPVANFRWNRAAEKHFNWNGVFVAIESFSIDEDRIVLSPSDPMTECWIDEHSDIDSSQDGAIALAICGSSFVFCLTLKPVQVGGDTKYVRLGVARFRNTWIRSREKQRVSII
ncbi:hypothetical protein V8E54_004319 [Elaphomyces granulatus]